MNLSKIKQLKRNSSFNNLWNNLSVDEINKSLDKTYNEIMRQDFPVSSNIKDLYYALKTCYKTDFGKACIISLLFLINSHNRFNIKSVIDYSEIIYFDLYFKESECNDFLELSKAFYYLYKNNIIQIDNNTKDWYFSYPYREYFNYDNYMKIYKLFSFSLSKNSKFNFIEYLPVDVNTTLYVNDKVIKKLQYACSNAYKLVIGKDVTLIDTLAFSVSSFEKVEFLGDNCQMMNSVFENCVKLRSIKLPNMNRISSMCFRNCCMLHNIIIPEGVEYIDSFAFMNSGLVDIKLPNSLKEIDGHAFEYTLFKEIDLKNVQIIRSEAFNQCNNLVMVTSNNLDKLSIAPTAFSDNVKKYLKIKII